MCNRVFSITNLNWHIAFCAELSRDSRTECTSAYSVSCVVGIGSVLLEEGNGVVTCESTASDVNRHGTIIIIGVGHRDGSAGHLSTVVVRIRIQVLCTRSMYGGTFLDVQDAALDGDTGVTRYLRTALHVDGSISVESHTCVIIAVDLTRDVDHVVHVAIDIVAKVTGNEHSSLCSVQCSGDVHDGTIACLSRGCRAKHADAVIARDGYVLGNRQHAVVLSACRCRAVYVQGLAIAV